MPGIVQALCEDLLMEGFDGRTILSHVGDGLMASLMAEVNGPHLQSKVLRVAASVVHADRHLSDGEAAMLGAISRHWGWGTVMQVDNATDGKGASVGLPTLAPPPDLLLPAQTKARRP